MRTLVELLMRRAEQAQADNGYHFLANGDDITETVTYQEVLQRAACVAREISKAGVQKGDPLVIALMVGTDFLRALFGTLLLGAIAVPVPSPQGQRRTERLLSVVKDLGRCFVLADAADCAHLEKYISAANPAARIIPLVSHQDCCAVTMVAIHSDDPCIIQYTSGSTAEPRGVILSHRNILEQERVIADRFGHDNESRILTWLPCFHDMGLIGGLLQPLYLGAQCFFMPPAAFLRRPSCWPLAISRHRATTSGGPDFGFALCAEKTSAAEREHLNLSCWRVAFNGADHVQQETLDRFVQVFGPHGFERQAFLPCYGLAEACLMVSGGKVRSEPTQIALGQAPNIGEDLGFDPQRRLIGCGQPIPGHEVVVVDPVSCSPSSPGAVGEIWVSGPTVAKGYWNKPGLTRRVFGARLVGEDSNFLRTGDLGLVANSELFILGRLDDMMVIRGQTIAPEDLELAAKTTPGCDGGSAAFLERSQLVLVQEIPRSCEDLETLARSIRVRVWAAQELMLDRLLLVRYGALPRTTSGKISRSETRLRLRQGMLPVLYSYEPNAEGAAAALMDNLDGLFAGLADLPIKAKLDPHATLLDLGLDSVRIFCLQARLREELGLELPTDRLIANPTLAELAEMTRRATLPMASRNACGPGAIPLTGSQRIIAISEELFPGDPFYHVGFEVHLSAAYDCDRVRHAVEALTERHELLRGALTRTEEGPAFRIMPPAPADFDVIKLTSGKARTMLDSLSTVLLEQAFDLSSGCNVRFLFVELDSSENILIGVVHHIVCDGWGLHVLLRDLAEILRSERPPTSLPRLPSYSDIASHVRMAERIAELSPDHHAYWAAVFHEPPPPLPLPTDFERPRTEKRAGDRVSRRLEVRKALSLSGIGRELGATTFTVFMALTTCLLHHWTGATDIVIGTACANRHLRTQMDLVGCFINFVPIRIRPRAEASFRELLMQVRDLVRAAMAHQGLPYDRLVQRLNPPRLSDRKPLFSVGVWQNAYPFSEAALDDLGPPTVLKSSTSDLDLRVVTTPQPTGDFEITFEFKTSLFRRDTIERLLDCWLAWADSLSVLMHVSLSDFPNPPVGITRRFDRRAVDATPRVVISANFTADGMAPVISHWLGAFGLPVEVVLAPFDQIHQELADPHSVTRTNGNGFNLICIDLASWRRGRNEGQVDELIREVARLMPLLKGCEATTILAMFPSEASNDLRLSSAAWRILEASADSTPGVRLLRGDNICRLYDVARIRDPFTDDVARLPFTQEFLAAAATWLARHCLSVRKPRAKAIVVDCDGTLWQGVCGEDGLSGISIGPDHSMLHAFLMDKQRDGILLCLCSKNNEADVKRVFEAGRMGPLGLEGIATSRLNWESKAKNILSIAEELALDPGAIVFVDDSPLECAEVKSLLPDVLTIEAVAPAEVLQCLQHLWALDSSYTTEEDRTRTRNIAIEKRRREALNQSSDLDAFIASLGVIVDIRKVDMPDLERVAQLSQRTTQFTSSGKRWTASRLAAYVETPGQECLSVHASDRFGSYGLVGGMLVAHRGDYAQLDAFFLSCRALGRGVEHHMLDHVKRHGVARGETYIAADLAETGRNAPARAFFISRVSHSPEREGRFVIAMDSSGSGQIDPPGSAMALGGTPPQAAISPTSGSEVGAIPRRDLHDYIMMKIRTGRAVLEAMASSAPLQHEIATVNAVQGSKIQIDLASIWKKHLRLVSIGSGDNFFDLGGNSLQMIYILQDINERFGLKLALTDFLDYPTLSQVAALIESRLSGSERTDTGDSLQDLKHNRASLGGRGAK